MNRVTGTHREHGRTVPLRAPLQPYDLRPRRDRRVPWVVCAGLVIVAAGGVAAVRTLSSPTIDVTLSSGSANPSPRVMVPTAVAPSVPGFVNSLRGLADHTASLTANGSPVPLEPGGAFTILIPQGTPEIRLVATGATGASHETVVAVSDVPVPSAYPATAALHVESADWADPVIRQQVLDLAASGRINAVELDIKNEAGEVGYASAVPLATTTGAAAGHYDARQAIDELHATGVRVIGRIVCFLDPVLSTWAWENGRADMIVLDGPGTAPFANNYGTAAFSNPASPDVREYQIDLAVEAAGLGFDEILYDYVRRPEGPRDTMVFSGLETSPDVAIARFVAETADRLDGALLGVSVFGISATRPEPTGQDINLLAPLVDYVSPMVYPSHWGSGEYGVADPVRQPADIVARSLADFERLVAGSGTAVVPWLQDFSSGEVIYGPLEVRAQIDAARAAGVEGFLLWNPTSTYTIDALDPPTG